MGEVCEHCKELHVNTEIQHIPCPPSLLVREKATLAFDDFEDMVGNRRRIEDLGRAVWPANLDGINMSIRTESKWIRRSLDEL